MKIPSANSMLYRHFFGSSKLSQDGRQKEGNNQNRTKYTAVIGLSAVILGAAAYVVSIIHTSHDILLWES